jgi:hypothetical protein
MPVAADRQVVGAEGLQDVPDVVVRRAEIERLIRATPTAWQMDILRMMPTPS